MHSRRLVLGSVLVNIDLLLPPCALSLPLEPCCPRAQNAYIYRESFRNSFVLSAFHLPLVVTQGEPGCTQFFPCPLSRSSLTPSCVLNLGSAAICLSSARVHVQTALLLPEDWDYSIVIQPGKIPLST
ncbi:hypothetical protein GALMADRAFT_934732 [Galerina marginata CBS 339.88]|uniref:Secreted protein n=1 Tax=Galerina marginata (strain CBS 339.88) TaxID=685588 RepID=A0A067SDV0_GALM3|nr:hypothetical protein GALMADRAFT_934732 [Galerina marginata CBS 339.88]